MTIRCLGDLFVVRSVMEWLFQNWNDTKGGSGCWAGRILCNSGFGVSSDDCGWLKTLWHGRRTLCHGLTHAFGGIVSRFLKLLYPLPETFRELWEFFRAEQNQDDRQDKNDFSPAEIEDC